MITVAIFNIIFVFFAYLARYKNCEFFLKISFFLIFLFLALRYDYGNDYKAYLELFLDVNRYESIDYFDESVRTDPGWLFICRLFKPLGFFTMVTFLAAFNCVIYYRFIKKYVSPDYYWLSTFIYVFDITFMLIQSSTMRQSMAICLFIFSIDFLYKKDAIRYFFCIFIAILLHKSAIILIPVYFIGLFNWKLNKIVGHIILFFFILLLTIGQLLLPSIVNFIDAYFVKYSHYTEVILETKRNTGLGVFYMSLMAFLVINYSRIQHNENNILFKIAIVSFMFVPFTSIIFLLERMQFYFSIVTIAVYPIILYNIKNIKYRIAIIIPIIFLALRGFYDFFQSEIWKVSFSVYHTIFSSPYWY